MSNTFILVIAGVVLFASLLSLMAGVHCLLRSLKIVEMLENAIAEWHIRLIEELKKMRENE